MYSILIASMHFLSCLWRNSIHSQGLVTLGGPVYLAIIIYSSNPNGLLVNSQMAEWAIDSEAMRARGIIVLVKSN